MDRLYNFVMIVKHWLEGVAMAARTRQLILAVVAGLLLPALYTVPVLAQKPKELLWTHAFDLSCRKLGEAEFTAKTEKFGVEAFKDANNDLGVFLSQAGSLAASAGFQDLKGAIKDSKGPEWITGLDLPARKAGEKEFTQTTKVHCMEVFRDPNTDNWIYITDKGVCAATTSKGVRPSAGSKAPKWSHSVDLMVRRGGEKEWKNATKFGIEVYLDQSTGNLLYISETGSIAPIPEAANAKPITEGKAPEWLHGLDLACRKHDEPSFSKDTRRFGIEVFRDENNGNLIFITETGNLAVTPGMPGAKAPTANVREPRWTHGLNMRCRKAGEKEFSEKTQSFGAEVFRDENVGVTLYILENGSLAAIAHKGN
jgi:hypothetical protein